MKESSEGFRKIALICVGQLLSISGSVISGLALSVWAWQQTQQGTTLALMVFFNYSPQILLASIVGEVIDRWPKKLSMILSDLGSALGTLALLTILIFSDIQIWHLYIYAAWTGIFNAFHIPSFSAAIPLIVKKEDYARANSFLSLANSGANVVAPAIAGFLLILLDIRYILILDLVTFFIAVSFILAVKIPFNSKSENKTKQARTENMIFGFRYIWNSVHLRRLLYVYILINILGAVSMALLAPLVLSKTNGSEIVLGSVLTSLGIGGIIGSLVLNTNKRFTKHLLKTVFISITAFSLLGYVTLSLARTPAILFLGSFCLSFFIPFMASAYQSLWQRHIPQNIMGKVFAAREALGHLPTPLIYLLIGPMADTISQRYTFVLETFGDSGGGIAFVFLVTGLLGGFAGLAGLILPKFKNLEESLEMSSRKESTHKMVKLD
jgi:MFS transporter, DHA3 family, macrolide efflux protein